MLLSLLLRTVRARLQARLYQLLIMMEKLAPSLWMSVGDAYRGEVMNRCNVKLSALHK